MGITAFSISLLEKAIAVKPDIDYVIEFGSQNLYLSNEENPPFADQWYRQKGIEYSCIDLSGDNNAWPINWGIDIITLANLPQKAPLISDFGSGEHSVATKSYTITEFHNGHIHSAYPTVEPGEEEIKLGFYNCWLNKHNTLEVGGLMVNENPLTGHWPMHAYSYLGSNFYQELSMIAGYEIIEAGINCATGNCETGKNLYSILRKTSEIFPSFTEFYAHLPIYRS